MTEQEARISIDKLVELFGYPMDNGALKVIHKALEELEQYRALGTPKEIKIREVSSAQLGKAYLSNLTELREYQSLGTVEELKEARELFEKTKIVGAENIIIIRKDGTYQVDGIDVLEAIQKQIPKTPCIEGDGYADGHLVYDTWICPNCDAEYEIDYDDYDYCPKCGQAINKSVMEGSEE